MPQKVIFATSNEGKLREAREILGPDCEVVSQAEAGIEAEAAEDGDTFEENALQKVRALRPFTDAVIIADDSGLSVDALDGAPGVRSARWMGHDTSYDVKNAKLLELLKDCSGQSRSARYVCAAAVSFPDGQEACALGTMEGLIAEAPAGDGGFGYDPVFFVPEYGRTAAELTADEKNALSHRGKAFRALSEVIKDHLI